MEEIKEKFEVVWNTKHKDKIKVVFKVPVGEKRWYEFWKKNNTEKIIIELMDRYKEDVIFDENSCGIFIPVKDSK